MAHYLYILKSLKDERLYTGCTANVPERIRNHNRGGTPSTRHRRPFQLIYVEEYPDRTTALARERELKSLEVGAAKFDLVAQQTPEMVAATQMRWLGETQR
jgi:putative endonuclease